MLRQRKIQKIMWPFTKKPYSVKIKHQDWRDYDGDPAVAIPKKVHGHGKNPRVQIDSRSPTPYVKVLLDGTVMIYRGLRIWQGTEFPVTVSIQK